MADYTLTDCVAALGPYVQREGEDYRFPCPECGSKDNLSVNPAKGCFQCWGCGYKGALGALLNSNGASAGLTVKQLADHKRLPVEHLRAWELADAIGRFGHPIVRFTYYQADGTLARPRIRVKLTGKRPYFWDGDRSAPKVPYGLAMLEQAREDGVGWFTEGETDLLTLAYDRRVALGMPGSTMVRKLLKPEYTEGVPQWIISQEPGKAGIAFRNDIIEMLIEGGWRGELRAVHWPEGCKDPSELYRRDPAGFRAALDKMIADAEVVALQPSGDAAPHANGEIKKAGKPKRIVVPANAPYDMVRAYLAAKHHDKTLRHWAGTFWRWNGSHYAEVSDSDVRASVGQFLDGECVLSCEPTKKNGGADCVPPTSWHINNTFAALAATVNLPAETIPPCYLDGREKPKHLIAVANGLLDLDTMALTDPDPAYFNLSALPVKYVKGAVCPNWLKFLKETKVRFASVASGSVILARARANAS